MQSNEKFSKCWIYVFSEHKSPYTFYKAPGDRDIQYGTGQAKLNRYKYRDCTSDGQHKFKEGFMLCVVAVRRREPLTSFKRRLAHLKANRQQQICKRSSHLYQFTREQEVKDVLADDDDSIVSTSLQGQNH